MAFTVWSLRQILDGLNTPLSELKIPGVHGDIDATITAIENRGIPVTVLHWNTCHRNTETQKHGIT